MDGVPRVSVIIPAYNAASTICRAVDSVLRQTFRDFEVIVVDDGSTDDTRTRLERYGDRVRYLFQRNQERSAARNNGIRHAIGDLLAFLDADDCWTPEKLEKQVALLDAHPGLGLVFAWAAAFDPRGRVLRILGTDFPLEGASGMDAFEALALRTSPPTLTVVARAECVHQAGLFDEAISEIEDWDLWLRISLRHQVGFVPEVLAYYRLSGVFKPAKLAAAGVPEMQPYVIQKAFARAETFGREALLRLKDQALARAHFKAALVHYAVADCNAGRNSLERAQLCDGTLFAGNAEHLVYALTDFGLNLYDTWTPPAAGRSFLQTFFTNLPPVLGHLTHLKRAAFRMLAAGHGFRAWAQNEPALARGSFFWALARYPELVRNRGIWSICVRSLLGERGSPHLLALQPGWE